MVGVMVKGQQTSSVSKPLYPQTEGTGGQQLGYNLKGGRSLVLLLLPHHPPRPRKSAHAPLGGTSSDSSSWIGIMGNGLVIGLRVKHQRVEAWSSMGCLNPPRGIRSRWLLRLGDIWYLKWVMGVLRTWAHSGRAMMAARSRHIVKGWWVYLAAWESIDPYTMLMVQSIRYLTSAPKRLSWVLESVYYTRYRLTG
ncbi:hypothetical protein Tco_0273508 [Tanacetum coccineum]